jgi:hypothetical protein
VIARMGAFGAFWYDFIVGDDWLLAVGVALALVVSYAVSRSNTHAWWIVPIAIVLLLPLSLWRATRKR